MECNLSGVVRNQGARSLGSSCPSHVVKHGHAGVRGHMQARIAPIPRLNWMEHGPAWEPMTRGALPPCVFPLALGSLGSCMGLEGTWGPVLLPPPPGMD